MVPQGDLDGRFDTVTIIESFANICYITRPANTTAYLANDAINNTGSITFANVSTGTSEKW